MRAGGGNRTLRAWQGPLEMLPFHRQLPKTFTFLSSCPQGPQGSPWLCCSTLLPCVFPVGWGQEGRIDGVSVDSSELGFIWKRSFGDPQPTGHYLSPRAICQSPSSFFFFNVAAEL